MMTGQTPIPAEPHDEVPFSPSSDPPTIQLWAAAMIGVGIILSAAWAYLLVWGLIRLLKLIV